MIVCIDPELCTGCELCVDTCPEVFELSEEGVAEVKLSQIPDVLEKASREAAEDCPTSAIIVEE